MAGALAELLIKLGLDARGFESGIDSSKKKVGEFGLNSQTAFKVVGGAAALGFGLAAKGALEMEDAQKKVIQTTGMSRDEAAKYVKELNGIVGTAKTVGMGFDEIVETGANVAQQFGLTGDKAKLLTEDIVGFAKVTGQDASDAALHLEDTLSAFGLSAEDAAALMDKLVASSDKFGTDAGPEALDALNGMAPALSAMGMGLDDGVELLNAFEQAGGNAGDATKGLQTAVAQLKPGENIDTLISRIASIEDPLLKNQAAAEAFGKKMGPRLAELIKPGMTSLDDFGISAEEAAGTIDRKADDMLTTTDKFKMFAEKLGGFFRDAGQTFGPFISGLGALTPLIGGALGKLAGPIQDGLKTALDKVAGSSVVKAAGTAIGTAVGAAQSLAQQLAAAGAQAIAAMGAKITAMGAALAPAGTAAGTVIGGAMQAAMLVGIPLAVGLALKGIGDEANKQNIPSQIWDFIFGAGSDLQAKAAQYNREVDRALAEGLTLAESKARAEQWLANMYGPDAAARFIPQIEALAVQGGTAAAEEVVHHLEDGLVNMPVTLPADWVVHRVDPAGAGKEALINYMGDLGVTGTAALGTALVGNTGTVADDLRETVVLAGRTAMVDAQNAFKQFGEETTAALGAGMNSAEATHGLLDDINTLKDALEMYLSPRQQALELIGSDYIKTLKQGMNSQDEDLRTAAQNLAIGAINTIEDAGLKGKKGQKGLKDIGILFDSLLESGMTGKEALDALNDAGVDASSSALDGVRSKYPQFFDAGAAAADKTNEGFQSKPWFNWGASAGGEWVSGIANGISRKQWFIEKKVDGLFKPGSPPAVAPNIDKYGFATGGLWATEIGRGATAKFLQVASGFGAGLGGLASGFAMPTLATASAGGSAGSAFNAGGITINIYDARDPDKTAQLVEDKLRAVFDSADRQSHRTYTAESFS